MLIEILGKDLQEFKGLYLKISQGSHDGVQYSSVEPQSLRVAGGERENLYFVFKTTSQMLLQALPGCEARRVGV